MDVILHWLELIIRIANIWIVKKETWNQIQVFLILNIYKKIPSIERGMIKLFLI